ncbi:inactive tyrosine-protein kinase PRAG1 [Megalops cyprinoides]|uniref:inactive tyrosine-protein kinase PRAG1 n=1 Tax=Megalops cyprinoides TaxID=118141 RepID=UPI00186524FB|nr:inactive tyrosine-protein kinase PRAG1 [Megalops cyprinoides]XP_036385972.1 inactive tyrosine-protein kinase PRAG1 [Megalops cyprinoides]
MSVCGEFAEHVWKPGSCKNCFHPRSAHRSNGSSAVRARNSSAGDEDDGLTHSASHCKPTIAVRPTMMNPDMPDMRTDVNMNTEQDNQKSPVDRLSFKKVLDLSPLYIDNNGCSKPLKESFLQSTATGKLDYTGRLPAGTLSPSCLQKESAFIFVTQEEVRGPHGLREIGTSDAYRPQVTSVKSTYTGSSSRCPAGFAQSPEGKTFSSGSCDRYSEVINDSCGSAAHEPQAPLEIAINIITATPTTAGITGNTEPSSTSPCPGFPADSTLQAPQACGRAVSFLSEPTSLSDSCSCRSSTDSLAGSQGQDVFGPPGLDRPQVFTPSSSPLSNTHNGDPRNEPIYAESTKRKRRPQDEGQNSSPDAGPTAEGQRATITVMAVHTEEDNRTFYLSSPDSAVSTQWSHFSPTATADPSSPAFKWPSSCRGSETATASLQPKPQASPPIPPKMNSRSPKLGTSSLSPVPRPEMPAHSPSAAQPTPQMEPPASGPALTAAERRHKMYNSTWNWEGRIEEEEEEGGEEAMPRSRASGLINGAAVSEPRDWSPAAHSKESTLPGTANNGASQKHPGSGVENSTHSRDMLAKAASFTTDLSEAKSGSHDPVPPPPPPKKNHRISSKMSQSSSELDKASQQGSVESLTHSLRGLRSSLATASSDSLHSDSRILSDGGFQDAAHVASPSLYPSSPLTPSPVSPHPDPFPSTGEGCQGQPPPLPEKKMVNRTVSAPGCPEHPRFPLSGSEDNVSRLSRSRLGLPSSPVDRRNLYSSSESLERCAHPPLNRPLRSRTLDEPSAKGRGRLGGCCRGGVTSSSSPNLTPSAAASGSSLQLQTLLSNMDSREGVYSKLGGLYAESLRRLALKCEDHFTRSQKNPLRFDESNWSLFKLTCNKPSCEAGDAVYYSASCASDPSNSYAVKICKNQTPDAKQGHLYGLTVQQGMPPHFNLQQDCGHFIACVPVSMLPQDEASGPLGQTEQERVVVITREVPHQSAADFVREWAPVHRSQPEEYERRVCFLLLQLCNGLEHLKEHGVTHRDLCLENLLLVPRRHGQGDDRYQKQLPRLLISSFSKAKQRSPDDPAADPRLKRDHARLAPEILSAAQYRKFDEFQTGILIYELLHQPNPFEVSPKLKEQDYYCEDLPPIPPLSLYSAGLQRLARLLLQPDPIKRIHIQEAKRALQSLLWGPRRDLMEQQWERPGESPRHDGLLNWLDVKRALLMMKFAERSLEPERNAELEDWLCCQYFSAAHPLSLCHTAELLYSLK